MIIYYTHSKSGAGHLLSTSRSGEESATPIRLEYFKEGNANIIYNIKPLDNGAHVPVALQGKLLRLRKNKPFIRCSREQHEAFKQYFAPLFHTENLVQHNLIGVDRTVTLFLNANLKQLDMSGSRPVTRHGDTLATDDTYGLLVTDMTAQPGEVFLELKPKWLVQSRDAPKSATRCRTCALRARRQSARLQDDASTDSTSFCPLGLVSSNIGERRRVFEAVLSNHCHLSHEAVQNIVSNLAGEVLPVIAQLKSYQAEFDPAGILAKSGAHISTDYLKAVTLRDCILLIKGTFSQLNSKFEIRLADLDFKQATPEKISQWKETESTLNREGCLTLLEPNKEAGHCDSTHHPYVVDGMGGRQVKDTYYPVIHHVEKCRDMSSSCFGPPPWPATQSPSMIGRKCYYEDLTWLDPLFKQYTITAQTILHKLPNPLGYQSYRPVSLAQPGCRKLHALTEPSTIISPPSGYLHYDQCTLRLCPLRLCAESEGLSALAPVTKKLNYFGGNHKRRSCFDPVQITRRKKGQTGNKIQKSKSRSAQCVAKQPCTASRALLTTNLTERDVDVHHEREDDPSEDELKEGCSNNGGEEAD
ncbi:inositol-pentakisphosphate 2-kinase-domain-containing protein [Delphinella strobiligena]|nr:inositol-pentakisphosphate 2-kinase-domain-containing protein [Delphinella strobiligena]